MIGQKNIIVNMGKLSNIYISIFTKKIYMCIKYVLQIYVWKIFVYLVFSQEYFHWVLDKSTKYTLRTYNRYGKFKEHIPHPHWPQLGGGGGTTSLEQHRKSGSIWSLISFSIFKFLEIYSDFHTVSLHIFCGKLRSTFHQALLNQKEKCILIYSTNPIFIWQQWLCRQMFTYKIRNSLNFDPPGPATTLKYCLNVKVFLSIIQYNIHDDVTVWKDDSALEVL